MPAIVVTICTRDPSTPLLARCLDALRRQSLPRSDWTVVVVDNGATPTSLPAPSIEGLPLLAVLHEPRPGQAFARPRAYAAALAADPDLIVIVDDDNFVAPNYLEQALKTFADHPYLGVVGGQNDALILGEVRLPPGEWWRHHFACSPVERPVFSESPFDWAAVPPGAGMVMRATVAGRFLDYVRRDPRMLFFGRFDPELNIVIAGEDTLLLETARTAGFAYGRVPELRLDHALLVRRLSYPAMRRLAFSNHFAAEMLMMLWGYRPAYPTTRADWDRAFEAWRPTFPTSPDRAMNDYLILMASLKARRYWTKNAWQPLAWCEERSAAVAPSAFAVHQKAHDNASYNHRIATRQQLIDGSWGFFRKMLRQFMAGNFRSGGQNVRLFAATISATPLIAPTIARLFIRHLVVSTWQIARSRPRRVRHR